MEVMKSILILDMVLDLMHMVFFSLSDGSGFGENVIIFGVDNSSFRYDDKKKQRYINSC